MPRLKPESLSHILKTIRIGERELARLTGWSHHAVHTWMTGKQSCPPLIEAWLGRRYIQWMCDPPPKRGQLRELTERSPRLDPRNTLAGGRVRRD